jgi:putative redox protein
MDNPTSTIVVRNTGGYKAEIVAGHHTLFADEPLSYGRSDQDRIRDLLVVRWAPALRSRCACMRSKKWPLDEVTVRLEHSRIHAVDDQVCEDQPVRLDQIDLALDLKGDLDEEQRARLREIAGKCPLHRTLSAGVRIEVVEASVT